MWSEIDLNSVANDSLPDTFVTLAELVWRKLEGMTQQAVADELGWSRTSIANYAQLSNINGIAWKSIVAAVTNSVTVASSSDREESGKAVTFTEFMLRDIIPFHPTQQTDLVNDYIKGTITKSKFKKLAENYRARNDAMQWAEDQLGDVGEALLAIFLLCFPSDT